MGAELAWLTIEHVAPLVARAEISPRELVEAVLCRIAEAGAALNAYITVDAEQSRVAAARAEAEILRGRYRGPLHGIPIALKDNIWTAGLRSTAGSRILADFVPVEDATVVRRLRRAGAIIIGKTNMSEFAYGATNNNAHYGASRNPWNPARTTGGSSGGAAAAVAAGLAFGALGTDTGGSIRIPAALCGVLGLKPTFGRVSCHGTMPLVPDYDHVGPIARSHDDVALLLNAIAGRDAHDPATASLPVPDFVRGSQGDLAGVTLGRPREFYFDGLSPDVARRVEDAIEVLGQCGASLREVRLPETQLAVERCSAFAYAEATNVHRRVGYFPGRAGDYGDDVRERLEQGAAVLAVDYAAAAEARKTLQVEFAAALSHVDALVAPTAPITAPPIGVSTVMLEGLEIRVRSALIRLNRPANITGLPSLTVPCGFDGDGLPVGLQLIGRAFDEAALIRIARNYLQARPVVLAHTSHRPASS